jgi:hypothetical protein
VKNRTQIHLFSSAKCALGLSENTWTYEDYVLDDFVPTHAGYHDAENFENPARAEDQRNEVRLPFGVVWFRS